ncbi:MAG: endonuclease domain-containing protein [Janthinobacterium lividum]
MTNYFNRSEVKDKRRTLRQSETAAETLLWERLRDRQVAGLKFRRQNSVGVYILDFYCPACHLAIELDGESHASQEAKEYDAERTAFLMTLSIRVLRFPNAVVFTDVDSVISAR